MKKALLFLLTILVSNYYAFAQTDFNAFWGERQPRVSFLLCKDQKWQQQGTEAISSSDYTVQYTKPTLDPNTANTMMTCVFDNQKGLLSIVVTYLVVGLQTAIQNHTLPKINADYAHGIEGPDSEAV